ncbi:DUF1826 domain-containing protein [Chryseobacterium wangxinyae]|uniref:DUF1826 domain-containing protein n=1 Tax=Chryseobacterium sp. CY350 TaxID=2997336 RepID=UPI002270AE0B|nr:DUF1826 domain-containing protein [Chryseobacterium sp. CY350]MCY0977681.1 DUF1826 domain-containing protein [Chryseobacterium sp. CY350]WBZ95310.1 DUF1826 domain-containing protein [Chryseobacterium sp. CY350]
MKELFPESTQIQTVSTFSDFIDTAFEGEKNAIFWMRNLEGDFVEVVSKLALKDDITEISPEDILSLHLSKNGDIARKIILNDLKTLSDSGAKPTLNLLKNYERDLEFDFISTDVYSFHVDRSPIPTSTILCTYYGAPSEILPNNQAVQKIMIPEIRAKLRELHTGSYEDFNTFLEEYFFDLHYEPKPNAQPINLGIGHLWKLSVDHPEQKVLPCIHRAPKENKDEFRLLLIC